MRLVVIDAALLELLGVRDSAETWQGRLHQGGLLADVRAETTQAEGLRQLPRALVELRGAEGRIVEASHPFGWLVGSVPPRVYWLMLAVFIACSMVGTALWGMGTLFAAAASPILLGTVAILGLGYAGLQEVGRREELVRAGVERERCGRALLASVERLLSESWVERGENVVLVSAPHRLWLRARLAELRARRAPNEGPERGACVALLEASLGAIESALRGAPERVVLADLTAELPELAAGIAGLALPASKAPEDRRLAELLLRG